TPTAIDNLSAEHVAGAVELVGDVMVDVAHAVQPKVRERPLPDSLQGEFVLATAHRAGNVDQDEPLSRLVELLLALPLPALFPVHPRTRKMMEGLEPDAPGLLLTDPLGYLDFLSLVADARAVLTDSGGIQEETTYLGIPCFTLRDNTERPVTIRAGTNTLLGLDPAAIAGIPAALAEHGDAPSEPPPLWDGRAAERIADAILG
nr:UDP-N-acetyl glucosamine 2-epimerase [Actinomycetota bacterium]